MSEQADNSSTIHERAARGEDPSLSNRKDRMEMWRPGYITETPKIAGKETLEESEDTKGLRAVRALLKPTAKYEGGN